MKQLKRVPFPRVLTEIPKIKIDPNGRQRVAKTLRGTVIHVGDSIWTQPGNIVLENFLAGEISRRAFHYAEVQYILYGKAELVYSLASSRHSVRKSMIAEAGDAYIIPAGADITFKVDHSGPYGHLCVIMPGFEPPEPENLAPEARHAGYFEGEE